MHRVWAQRVGSRKRTPHVLTSHSELIKGLYAKVYMQHYNNIHFSALCLLHNLFRGIFFYLSHLKQRLKND